MLKGDLAVQKSGIVPLHTKIILDVASEYQCIVMFCPVNSHATGLINEGYIAKPANLKGNLATWGPQAGYICIDQAYCNTTNSGNEEIAKLNREIEESLQSKEALAVPLILSKERADYLFRTNIISTLNYQDGFYRVYSAEHAEITFVLYPNSLMAFGDHPEIYENDEVFHKINLLFEQFPALFNGYWVFVEKKRKLQTLWVLADPLTHIPFTSDYRLFSLCPHINNFSTQSENKPAKTKIERDSRHFPSVLKPKQGQKEKKISQAEQGQINHLTRLATDQINLRISNKPMIYQNCAKNNAIVELHFPISCFTPWSEIVAATDLFQLQAILRDISRTGFIFTIGGLLSQIWSRDPNNENDDSQSSDQICIDNLEIFSPPPNFTLKQ